MTIDSIQLDRAIGAVLASAAGDALGSQYEFGPALLDTFTPEFGDGIFGHGVGEWTDDTSMAVPLLDALAEGSDLADADVQSHIVTRWIEWSRSAKDVGAQTRAVFRAIGRPETAAGALKASEALHERSGRSGGNGSLMRTGPVALGYLERTPAELVAAASAIARLTHWEDDNADACALWCLAIRHAVLTGEFDMRCQLERLPAERRHRWAALVDEALVPGAHPRDFQAQNGWVVRAFQGALAAIAGADSLTDAIERAIRGGGDTDTVAAIRLARRRRVRRLGRTAQLAAEAARLAELQCDRSGAPGSSRGSRRGSGCRGLADRQAPAGLCAERLSGASSAR